ncbi:MAG: glutathione S-transferase [Chitinophagales bacterium]|nr:glutathione S-transferase [Hyphomicrobiales bacterium]
MLKIYGRANSINVRKVLWAADEIGVEYSREDWGRGFRPVSDAEFAEINPLGLIPAIDDDGFSLSESNTIIRYLAGKHGRADLLPLSPQPRATVERWMDWQATDMNNSWFPAFFALVVKSPLPGGQEVVDASIAKWTANMARVEAQLAATGAHICGADFTLADIGIGLAVHRWFSTPLERPDLSAVSAYYERLSLRPAYIPHGRNGLP